MYSSMDDKDSFTYNVAAFTGTDMFDSFSNILYVLYFLTKLLRFVKINLPMSIFPA